MATCGDGHLWTNFEDCDDGNDLSTDDCIDCTPAVCGDGFVQMGVEACDDDNSNNTDACVACSAATCGDGFVHAGVEQCDDGNMIDDDLCSNTCEYSGFPPCFESDVGVLEGNSWVVCAIDGNSAWVSANIGGLYQADQICAFLGFDTLAEWGGTCGNVCGYCEGFTSCENPGSMTFDGGGANNWPQLTFTVHWLCTN